MENTEQPAIGKITSGLSSDTFALKTIDFVYKQLPFWRNDPDRRDAESEKELNSQLCKFLNSRARNGFSMAYFHHEEPQSGRRIVDMSVLPVEAVTYGTETHTIYDPIVVFEGKRLPAPSSAREKEYVTGGEQKSGGIQRFKLGLHGADHDIAAIVGYLQEGSASDWHGKINKWIIELSSDAIKDVCVWNMSEILGSLEEDPAKGISTCESTHDRNTGAKRDNILLHHLWVVMHT